MLSVRFFLQYFARKKKRNLKSTKNRICNYIFKDFEVKEEQYLWFFFLQILVLTKFSLDPRQWTEVETYCLRISHLKRQLKSILWILQVISQFICLKLNSQELLVKWATTKKFPNRLVKYMKWRCRCKFNFFKIWFTTRHIFFVKKKIFDGNLWMFNFFFPTFLLYNILKLRHMHALTFVSQELLEIQFKPNKHASGAYLHRI